jgi:hypothetical protein
VHRLHDPHEDLLEAPIPLNQEAVQKGHVMNLLRKTSLLTFAGSLVLALWVLAIAREPAGLISRGRVQATAHKSFDLISGERMPAIAEESVDLISGERMSVIDEESVDLVSTAQIANDSVPREAALAEDDYWQLGISPYLWFAGVNGNGGARGNNANVHPSATDVLSHFTIGLKGSVLWNRVLPGKRHRSSPIPITELRF